MSADIDMLGPVLTLLMVTIIWQGPALAAHSGVSMDDIARLDDARDVYQTNCAACHGFDGVPMMPGIPNFSGGERLDKAEQELMASMQNGKESESGGIAMPPWQGTLSDEEMLAVLDYIRVIRGDLVFQEICTSCHSNTIPPAADSIPSTVEKLYLHQGPFNLCKGTDLDNMIERDDIISVIRFLGGISNH
jgi:cytochrome c553